MEHGVSSLVTMSSLATEVNRIVVMPVNDSATSERAIDWFADNVHKEGDLVILVHVVEPYSGLVLSGSVGKPPAITEDCTKSLRSITNEGRNVGHGFLERARSRNIRAKFFLHYGNKPAEHVVRTAREHGADLIVMGSRGTSSLKKTILGGMSDYILHHTDVPCIIVPPVNKRKERHSSTTQSPISTCGVLMSHEEAHRYSRNSLASPGSPLPHDDKDHMLMVFANVDADDSTVNTQITTLEDDAK